MDGIEELKFLGKFKKKIGVRGWGGEGGGGAVVGLGGWGGQGGCERRIEVFVKIQKKIWGVVGGGGGGVGFGGSGWM